MKISINCLDLHTSKGILRKVAGEIVLNLKAMVVRHCLLAVNAELYLYYTLCLYSDASDKKSG